MRKTQRHPEWVKLNDAIDARLRRRSGPTSSATSPSKLPVDPITYVELAQIAVRDFGWDFEISVGGACAWTRRTTGCVLVVLWVHRNVRSLSVGKVAAHLQHGYRYTKRQSLGQQTQCGSSSELPKVKTAFLRGRVTGARIATTPSALIISIPLFTNVTRKFPHGNGVASGS
jgi:hypothetical protein